MISVSIIGFGNVGSQLSRKWNLTDASKAQQSGTSRVQLTSILTSKADQILAKMPDLPLVSTWDAWTPAAVNILAVADDQIEAAAQHIADDALVVHTAGSVAMNVLKRFPRRGVFYPLQTISTEASIDWTQVPFCIEAAQEADYPLLEELAQSLGSTSRRLNSHKRKEIHLAAVMLNNFTHHLLQQVAAYCEDLDLPQHLLQPLLEETVSKFYKNNLLKTQTGPARRGDYQTLKSHLELLKGRPQQGLYHQLTNSILHTYGREKL
ncbi:Rossmann-like and DUF2520 domain-containing protein [Croceiramulus getboli]|nr:DUF2520 domain-containing protein [Flavobacteriaceae bacterium YJPT1-3]